MSGEGAFLSNAGAVIPSEPDAGAGKPVAPARSGELFLSPYQAVERDALFLQSEGLPPLKIAKELGEAAARAGAPLVCSAIRECGFEINRETARGNRHRNALKALLFSLHARPLFGGPHLSLEDAIAEANAVLDGDRGSGS